MSKKSSGFKMKSRNGIWLVLAVTKTNLKTIEPNKNAKPRLNSVQILVQKFKYVTQQKLPTTLTLIL